MRVEDTWGAYSTDSPLRAGLAGVDQAWSHRGALACMIASSGLRQLPVSVLHKALWDSCPKSQSLQFKGQLSKSLLFKGQGQSIPDI